MSSAKIISRNENPVSSWVRVVAKEVQFDSHPQTEIYHCLGQPDYIAILAQTRGGLIPLVRQYRPAVESYTWELPAGLVEQGEDPSETCRRELKEETGLTVENLTCFGNYYADTGRLENRLHAFFVSTSDPDPSFVPETGVSVDFVDWKTLHHYLTSGKLQYLHHAGIVALALLEGVLESGRQERTRE